MLTGKPKSKDMVIPWEISLYITKCIFLLKNRRKMEVDIMHYIYCYRNKINGHKYVGQTNNLGVRYVIFGKIGPRLTPIICQLEYCSMQSIHNAPGAAD